MKKILSSLALASSLLFAQTASAAVVSYDLSWSSGGYSATGSFSFDTTVIGGDNLITQVDLSSFQISFFDPTSTLLKSYSALADAQLFSFHTDTLLIDQGPSVNLIVGQIAVGEYVLIRGNGCTGDEMLLYTGNGGCAGGGGTYVARGGELIATPSGGTVPAPTPLALIGLALTGLALQRARRA